MPDAILSVLIGLVSGLLAGQFGIGGGLITTPAIRLLLGRPALVAVGTPLPIIVPTAIVGAWSYLRAGLADMRAGVVVGGLGAGFAVLGALATRLVGGPVVLLVTAGLIVYMAIDMVLLALRERGRGDGPAEPFGEVPLAEATGRATLDDAAPGEGGLRREDGPHAASLPRLAVLGVVAGLYSGFLGLGGGFVIVPVLSRWLRFPLKRAIGTSLVAISIMAVPGSVTHWLLGNVDLRLAATMALGVVPGTLLGARVTQAARESSVRVAFAVLLLVSAASLVASETGLL